MIISCTAAHLSISFYIIFNKQPFDAAASLLTASQNLRSHITEVPQSKLHSNHHHRNFTQTIIM